MACGEHIKEEVFDVAGEDGNLRFSLTWDGSADLDLYVTDPFGYTINFDKMSSNSGGLMDVDCIGDCPGYNSENIMWPKKGPNGTYTFYVNNHDGSKSQAFTIQVLKNAEVVRTINDFTDQSGFNSKVFTYTK